MSQRWLFLLGGDAVLDAVAEEFVPAAGGAAAVIVLLVQGGPGWQRYVARYAEPWKQRGVTHIHAIAPDDSGKLDVSEVLAQLQRATGICIGGGHTPTYHRLYATGEVGRLIRARHQAGVPVAGLSAGALIALEHCVLDADEIAGDALKIGPGLGLVRDLLVEVHFTERNRLSHLLEAMVSANQHTGWGIDESACMVITDGLFTHALGHSVYKVVMTDFVTRTHEIAEYARSR